MYAFKAAQLFLSGKKRMIKDPKKIEGCYPGQKKTSWYLARKLDTKLVLEHSLCTLM